MSVSSTVSNFRDKLESMLKHGNVLLKSELFFCQKEGKEKEEGKDRRQEGGREGVMAEEGKEGEREGEEK